MRLIDADAFEIKLALIAKAKAKSEAQKALMGRCIFCLEKEPTIKTFTLADIEEQYRKGLEKGLEEQRPHGECNQCRYYEGVHGVQGHAPCSFWKIGGVLWNDFCSRYEKEW